MLLQITYKDGRSKVYQGVFDFYVDDGMFLIDLKYKGEIIQLETENDKIKEIYFAEAHVLNLERRF